jgi:hypothetical protein
VERERGDLLPAGRGGLLLGQLSPRLVDRRIEEEARNDERGGERGREGNDDLTEAQRTHGAGS